MECLNLIEKMKLKNKLKLIFNRVPHRPKFISACQVNYCLYVTTLVLVLLHEDSALNVQCFGLVWFVPTIVRSKKMYRIKLGTGVNCISCVQSEPHHISMRNAEN